MSLTLALGFRHVREMELSLTMQEYCDWIDFYALQPWGCEAQDYRFDVLARLIIEATGNKPPEGGFFQRDPDRFHANERIDKRQSKVVLENQLMAAFASHNARMKPEAS